MVLKGVLFELSYIVSITFMYSFTLSVGNDELLKSFTAQAKVSNTSCGLVIPQLGTRPVSTLHTAFFFKSVSFADASKAPIRWAGSFIGVKPSKAAKASGSLTFNLSAHFIRLPKIVWKFSW